MFHTDRAIIVEGRYDKAKLSGVTDALIVTTEGFRIFSDREKQVYIKKLALEKGLMILTDSDAAGFRIRSFLRNIVGDADIVNVYIPDIFGREKRKETPSKEGKLGVEGIPNDILEDAVRRSGAFEERAGAPQSGITAADLYEAGLTGKENAAEKRRRLLRKLGLPGRLSGKNLLQTLNAFTTKETLLRLSEESDKEGPDV